MEENFENWLADFKKALADKEYTGQVDESVARAYFMRDISDGTLDAERSAQTYIEEANEAFVDWSAQYSRRLGAMQIPNDKEESDLRAIFDTGIAADEAAFQHIDFNNIEKKGTYSRSEAIGSLATSPYINSTDTIHVVFTDKTIRE